MKLPQEVIQAWEERNGPVVFTTADAEGNPNAIYATCVGRFDESTLVIADNYFDKTRANIKNGSRGSVLFITKGNKAYQVKGTLEYHTEGALFDFMKSWNPEKHSGHAAAVLRVKEAFSGAKKLG